MRRLLGTLSLCALAACGGNALAESHPPHATERPPLGTTADPGLALATWNAVHDYALTLTVRAVADYTVARTQADVATYVEAVAAAERQAALDRYLASIPRPRPRSAAPSAPRPSAPSAPSSGGSCGGAGYADQFIGRESGGNAYIVNPGNRTAPDPYSAGAAWGCYQIIPSTWASSCGDITTYDPASQARCAARLPASAWASSGPT